MNLRAEHCLGQWEEGGERQWDGMALFSVLQHLLY